MSIPVRVDLLGSDDEMLSLVGMRAYTGDDAVGALLAAVAAAVDRPLQPVLPVRRRRRRIGFGVFATAAFLASGSGMAAAVSDGLPSVEDSIVALRSDRGDAPGAPAAGSEVQRQPGLETFARLGNPVGAVTVVDLVSGPATAPWLDTTSSDARAGDSSGMPSAAGVPAGSPTALESLRLPPSDPTLADQGAGRGSGGSAVVAGGGGGGGANPATGGSGSGAATGSGTGTGSNPGMVSGGGTVTTSGNGTAGPGNAGNGTGAANPGTGNANAGGANANANANAGGANANGNAGTGNANAGNGTGNAGGGNAPAATSAPGSANRATAAPAATPSAPVGATGKGGSPR